MDKREFLEILKQSLNGEVTSDVIEQNISYYNQYISAQSVEEETKILELLGDPRLIARTVIETDRAAKQKGKFSGNHSSYTNSYTNNYTDEETENYNEKSSDRGRNIFNTNFKWYHKIVIALIILVVIILMVFIGRLIIGFLFAFGLPIILLMLIMALFRKR
jgi:uncharacterized membrane protein